MSTTTQIDSVRFADVKSAENMSKALFVAHFGDDSCSPLIVLNSERPGVGKSSVARIILKHRSSHPVAFRMPKTDDSFRRFIPGVLADGYLFLDDVTEPLVSSLLAELITSETWEYRKLGTAEKQTRKVDLVVLVTGNNVRLSYDLQRRAIWIKLA